MNRKIATRLQYSVFCTLVFVLLILLIKTFWREIWIVSHFHRTIFWLKAENQMQSDEVRRCIFSHFFLRKLAYILSGKKKSWICDINEMKSSLSFAVLYCTTCVWVLFNSQEFHSNVSTKSFVLWPLWMWTKQVMSEERK